MPCGVEADGSDSLYVADVNNHTIRKVALSTGDVTTVVGSAGLSGSADGVGADARFSGSYGVAVDGTGSLSHYVSDSANHTIRKVVLSTGAVTTLAGQAGKSGTADGTGSVAQFQFPADLACDGVGALYVADRVNYTIRKVVLSTGAVTTLAGKAGMPGSADGGGTAAQFAYPVGMAVDGSGNLYVADTYNHTIRKVVLNTGAVTTFAGSAGASGSTDGTSAAARFNLPLGVTIDHAGNLFVIG